jgi:fermentation-respiration switch protein FrsA (DUF1100 family)
MLKAVALLGAVALGGLFGLDRLEQSLVYPFDPARAVPPEGLREVMFESGGQALVLWVARPEAGKPVILYFHGNAGNLAARAGRFQRFLERGYGVVAMGYRGSSGSSGRPTEEALSFDAARLFARIADHAGAAPVVIYGESLGTGVAVAVLARGAREPAAVVLEAPFASVTDVALAGDPRLAPLVKRMKNRWDSLSRADALRAPLLVIHGTRDTLIPIEMGRALFAAAPATDKRFLAVKGAGHNDLWRSDTLPELWAFIDSRGVSR